MEHEKPANEERASAMVPIPDKGTNNMNIMER